MKHFGLILGLGLLSHGFAAGFIGKPEQIGISTLCRQYSCSPVQREKFTTEWGTPVTEVRFTVSKLNMRIELGIDRDGLSRYAEAEAHGQKLTAVQLAFFRELIRVAAEKMVSQSDLKACVEEASHQPTNARPAGL